LGKGVLVVTVVALAGLVVGIAYALPRLIWVQGPTTQGPWTVWGMPMQWDGMMGGGCPCMGGWWGAPPSGQRVTIQQAVGILERYIGPGFRLKEVMEFQHNFYAVVVEEGTGGWRL
jgi:hypothetical protein